MSGRDASILLLIQRTPHLEPLAKGLQRKCLPSVDLKSLGTRFQKCRRLYDAILVEAENNPEVIYSERQELIKKIFHDTGNGQAGELLYSLPNLWVDKELLVFSKKIPSHLKLCDFEITTAFMMKLFRIAKMGNPAKLELMLRCVALQCAGFEAPPVKPEQFKLDVPLETYRENLGEILLTKRDWMDKTLLHVAADSKSIECLQVVLQFAQEARKKGELLDARDAFGQTGLHLAVRRKYAHIIRKLIVEGSNLFIKNNNGHTALQMIYQSVPSMALFLLDTTVTISGDMSSESTYFIIDFGVLTTPMDFSGASESRMRTPSYKLKLRHKMDKESIHVHIDDCDDDAKCDATKATLLPPSPSSSPNTMTTESAIPFSSKDNSLLNQELTILDHVVDFDQRTCRDILAHPVTQSFVNLKWTKLRYMLWITYTGLRIGVFGLYIYLMYHIYFIQCPLNSKTVMTTIIDLSNNTLIEEPVRLCKWSDWTLGLLPIIVLFISIFIVHEMFRLKKIVKYRSSLLLRILMKVIFLCIVISTCIPPFMQRTILDDYQYSLATIGTLLSSALILQVVSNSNCDFIVHSIYIHVYMKVMFRFMSVIVTFLPLIIGFTLSLNIMYPQLNEFSTFFHSLFRLVIMLQGEFDFESKIYSQNTEMMSNNIFWTGQILFGVLGCVLTLVLIDVFLGYTVSDINELKEQAEFVRCVNQVRQMKHAELQISQYTTMAKMMGFSKLDFFEYFNVIPKCRKDHNRTDVALSLDELGQNLQNQYRKIINDI